MSQAAPGASAPEPRSIPSSLGIVRLRGLIQGKPRTYRGRSGEQLFATLIRLPNPDEFTSLGVVEVQSTHRLGETGDTWEGRARVSGTVRTFQYTDRASGEIRSGVDCTIRLTVVE